MTTNTERLGDWMETYTGAQFWPVDPRSEEVDPVDIAHALSLLCRYAGHTDRFYSVAEHCVVLSHWVAPKDALHALLHDATEAYVVDIPRPLKRSLPEYRDIEQGVWLAIAERFGVQPEIPQAVLDADTRILLTERAAFKSRSHLEWGMEWMTPLPVTVEGWQPEEAERRYAERLAELLADLP